MTERISLDLHFSPVDETFVTEMKKEGSFGGGFFFPVIGSLLGGDLLDLFGFLDPYV